MNTPGTCKDCRWWGRDKDGQCDKVGNDNLMKDPATFFDIDAGAADDSNLYADLITGPDFGCVQFEPQPPTTT